MRKERPQSAAQQRVSDADA